MGYSRDELEGGKLIWLLELELRGKVYRFSTDVIEVASGDTTHGPSSYHYKAGLEFLEYEDVVGIMEADASSREVSVSVQFQSGQQEGWTSLTDTGRDVGQARGELSLILDGMNWKQRHVIVQGFLDGMSYGSKNEPVEFTLTQSDHLDPAKFPPTGLIVNHVTFKNGVGPVSGHTLAPDDSARNQFYPWCFGSPGKHPPRSWWGQNAGVFDATPGLLVEIDITAEVNTHDDALIMVAGHEVFNPTTNTYPQVTVFSDDWAQPEVRDVQQGTDSLGNIYSYVNMGTAVVGSRRSISVGQEFWIGWHEAQGLPKADRSGPLQGAGEIIEYLLEQSGLKVDRLRSRQPLREVNDYALDFWVNEQRSPWEIISEDIMPFLPLSSYVREDGISFVYWNWCATKQDATEQINIQEQFGDRTGPVDVSSVSEVYNTITLEYCMTGPDGNFRKKLTYTHDNFDNVFNVTFNPYSFASFTRFGKREAPPMQAPTVERDDTASAILDWMIRYYGQTRRTVTYRLGQKYQSLEPGHVVTLTDADIGFDQVVCLVSGLIRAPGLTEVTFTTVPDWATDANV